MDMYERMFNRKRNDCLWVVCHSNEEIQTFKDWVVGQNPSVYLEHTYAIHRHRVALLTVLRDPFYGTEYVIDRINTYEPVHIGSEEFMEFEEWYTHISVPSVPVEIAVADVESLL